MRVIGSRTWRRRLVLVGPALALACLFVVTGLRGVDFGRHWDEQWWQIRPARDMVETGVFLPRLSYIYPSLCKWLLLLPTVPAAVEASHAEVTSAASIQAAMVHVFDAPDFLLTARRLFIVVSALAILWVYGAALALRRPWWEAFVAAAGVGLSWEYAYHARWVATDCILVQFSALTLLMLALFRRTGRPPWLYAAAAAAGLGAGTKFQGVVLLVPAMLLAIASSRRDRVRHLRVLALRLAALGATALAVYVLTTPATLLDPFLFAQKVNWISNHYESGHHNGYSVDTAWQHAKLVATYLASAYFSPYWPVAMALFAAAVAGAVIWIRSDRRMGIALVSLPLVFLALFCGKFRAVIVRNYLMVAPFLALFAARAVGELFERLRRPWARLPLAGALAAALAANAVWLVRAGESIRDDDPAAHVREAIAYVAHHPRVSFRLSDKVAASAAAQKLTLPPNVSRRHDTDEVVFFAMAEGPDELHWKSNDPHLTRAVFGPLEVNFDWYSSWVARDRVVVMTVEKARATGAPMGH